MSVKENTIWEVTLTPTGRLDEVIRFTEKPTAHHLRVVLSYRKNLDRSRETPRADLLLEIAQFVPQDFADPAGLRSGEIKVADMVIANVITRIKKTYTVK